MTNCFITFAGGGRNYTEAGERLIHQANYLQAFNKTVLYTDDYLKKDPVFWNRHSHFIENNPRGYGYWLWKPYVIKKAMEELNNGDVLLYLDCGCELDIRKRERLFHFFELVKQDFIIGTRTFPERDWNKMDLILHLETLQDEYLNTPQHQAGALLFLVCDKTRALVNEWYELGCHYI